MKRFLGLAILTITLALDITAQAAQSSITLPNRRLTEAERNAWIAEYREMGGATEFELETVRVMNTVRAELGLSQLTIDNTLMMAARFYAQNMRQIGRLGHNVGPYATNPAAEHGASANVAAAFDARLRWGGGNGALGGFFTPQSLVTAWMNSPGHRAYIVSPEHRFIGVGSVGTFPQYNYMFLSNQSSITPEARQAAAAQQERQRQEALARQLELQRIQEREDLRRVSMFGYNFAPDMPFGLMFGGSSVYFSFSLGMDAHAGQSVFAGGSAETTRGDVLLGYSFPINRNFRVPFGGGVHFIESTAPSTASGFTSVFEAGLQFVPFESFFISSTYRIRGLFANSIENGVTHGFTIGVGRLWFR